MMYNGNLRIRDVSHTKRFEILRTSAPLDVILMFNKLLPGNKKKITF